MIAVCLIHSAATVPEIPAFSSHLVCSMRVALENGSYVPMSRIVPGMRLFSDFLPDRSEGVVVRNTTMSTISIDERDDTLVTLEPDACGPGKPRVSLHITENHAIRCPSEMYGKRVPSDMLTYIHMFPREVHTAHASTSGDLRLCNIDVGDPEIPLMVEGLLVESWDGKSVDEPRGHTWLRTMGKFVRRVDKTWSVQTLEDESVAL